jgi:hypothetical protein
VDSSGNVVSTLYAADPGFDEVQKAAEKAGILILD